MKRILPALAFAWISGTVLGASAPGLVSYQGVLRSASGAPVNATVDMVFRFVDAPSSGTLLLTDYHTGPNSVVVSGGLFTTLLGGGTLAPGTEPSLDLVFANHAPVYLEVQVGAETLTPRVQIVSNGFALNAGRLGGQPAGFFLDTSAGAQTKQGPLTSNTGLIGNAGAAGTGVDGTTATGSAVRGTSTGTSGITYGVYGKAASTDGTGVAGEAAALTGSAWGVYGKSASSAGVGVVGSSLATSGATEGVRGQSTSTTGKGVVGVAFATSGASYGVYGESQSASGTGVYGRATASTGSTNGLVGETYSSLGTGVSGIAHASNGDAWGVYGATTSPTGYGVVSDGDFVTSGDIYATGTKYFLAEHPLSPELAVRYACLEGEEVGIYYRGSGRLNAGESRVELPDPFALLASGRISVDVTPAEDCAGLYVPETSVNARGFTVRELGGGKSNAAFSYLVFAERRGREGARAVRPISLSDKILTSSRFSPLQKSKLRAALFTAREKSAEIESNQDTFVALQRGDFDEACRLLDGCAAQPGSLPSLRLRTPAALAPAVSEASRPATASANAGRAQDAQPAGAPRLAAAPAFHAQPFPLTELHLVSETVEAGDVLVLDRLRDGALRLGSVALDPTVVGIVAGVDGTLPPGSTAPVALSGTVLCKVDADYDPISPGDLLVVSGTPGHAMRAALPAAGSIVGKALEARASGRGLIRVLVMSR